jgi:flagellar assembly protein FliH
VKVRRLPADGSVGPTRFEYRRFARADAEPEQPPEGLWPEAQPVPDEDAAPEPEDITSTENYKEGYRQGLDAGIQEGYERGGQEKEQELTSALEEHFSTLVEAVRSSAGEVSQETERVRQDFEAWLPRAVLLVSECVLRHETQTDVTSLAKVVREAVAALGVAEPLTVRLHPDDYGILAQQPAEAWSNDHLTFSPDQGVTRGGAVVESSTQVVDARMEARLLEAARTILFPPDGAADGSPAQ